jgi:hypothetical protein
VTTTEVGKTILLYKNYYSFEVSFLHLLSIIISSQGKKGKRRKLLASLGDVLRQA